MSKNNLRKVYAATLIFILCIVIFQIPAVGESLEPLTQRKTIYVDDDAICPGKGTLSAPYCNIQYAINNSITGDDIKLASGEYFENIIIEKEITIPKT